VPNKAALITAIADAILADLVQRSAPPTRDEAWTDWLTGLAKGSAERCWLTRTEHV